MTAPAGALPAAQAAGDGKAIAVALVKRLEGCRLAAYRDTAGIWTIGVGCTRLNGKPVTASTPPITMAQAEAALAFELAQTEKLLASTVKVPITPAEWAAMASLAYNIGGGAFANSTLLRMLNTGDRAGAAAQFPRWNLAGGQVCPGLTTRRAIERSVFEGRYDPLTGTQAPPVPTSLRLGDHGDAVHRLQEALTRAGYPAVADADFGPATKRALERFQAAKGLPLDGVAGPQTLAALGL